MKDQYPERPYENWSSNEDARWIDAGHQFGVHLMKNVRVEALSTIPEDLSDAQKEAAAKAVDRTLYAMMQLLDGIFINDIDSTYTIDYVLSARIRERGAADEVLETFELAPEGDGLCMGIHGWLEGKFWRS